MHRRSIVVIIGLALLGVATAWGLRDFREGSQARPPVDRKIAAGEVQPDESKAGLEGSSPPHQTHQDPMRALEANPEYEAELEASNLASSLPAHAARAQRDPVFAYALASALQSCSVVEEVDANFRDNISAKLSADKAEEVAEEINDQYAHCSGLEFTAEQRYNLVELAAQAGVLDAQVNFRAVAADHVASEAALRDPGLLNRYKRSVRYYARRAALTGRPDALYNAYEVMSSDLFGSPDPVAAHAYLVAFERSSTSARARTLLSRNEDDLDAAQLAEARALARKMMER